MAYFHCLIGGSGGGGYTLTVACDPDFAGTTITCTDEITTLTKSCPSTSPYEVEFNIPNGGYWTISGVYEGDIISTEVYIPDEVSLDIIHVPEGATVTPTDDIQTWLKCAGITDKSYTTLAEVLADTETYSVLLADSNACDYMVRSTTWVGNVGAVPVMTSNTTPSGECIATNSHSAYGNYIYRAFDNDLSDMWADADNASSSSIGYKFEESVVIRKFSVIFARAATAFKIQGSNDNSSWMDLYSKTGNTSLQLYDFITNPESYRYYRLLKVTGSSTYNTMYVRKLQFYTDLGITGTEASMRTLGKYDYACSKLLSNSTWKNAICNSEYFEYVLNIKVPKMTSNTAPSGVVSAYSSASGHNPYYAFDGVASDQFYTTEHGWSSSNSALPQWLQYEFPDPITITCAKIRAYNTTANNTKDFQIRASNSSSFENPVVLYEGQLPSETVSSKSVVLCDFENSTAYKYYRIHITSTWGSGWSGLSYVEFYGRKPVIDSYIPLVPAMTSDTTPSGECISGPYDSGRNPYNVFAGTNTGSFYAMTSTNNNYIGYHFPAPVKVDAFFIHYRQINASPMPNMTLQGSNNGTDWISVGSPIQLSTSDQGSALTDTPSPDHIVNSTDNNAYSYWRLLFTDTNSSSSNFYRIQFYGKLDKTIVHSAPYDTIYYKDNGTDVPLCITNVDGIGEFDVTSLEAGVYNIYSSVTKDPNNLSNDYYKNIRITNTQLGHTTEMYIMPDNALYWWGNGVNNIESMTTANGWSGLPGGYSFVNPTFNTNYIYMIAQNNQASGVCSKNPIKCSSIKTIFTSSGSAGAGFEIYATTNKVHNTVGQHTWSDVRSSISSEEYSGFDNGNYYVATSVINGARVMNLYAILTSA